MGVDMKVKAIYDSEVDAMLVRQLQIGEYDG